MDNSLHRLQLTELEILQVIDDFCKKHNIRYSLYAGTLLGAVRHQGFIPWDDDLDICMERADYDRFVRLWEEEKPVGYVLMNKETAPGFDQSFTKIRKEHTTFLQKNWEIGQFHTGIFVDVFPVDRIPDGRIKRLWYRFVCLCYLIFTREFIPPKGSWLQKLTANALLFCIRGESRSRLRKKLLRRLTKYNQDKSLSMIMTETKAAVSRILPSDLMDVFITMPFEGRECMCTAQWEAFLEIKYGDYMTLPPESGREWTHHPILLDFEHDYEELQQQTKTDRLS